METNERDEAFDRGYACGRRLSDLVVKAATIGLTSDEVQTAIKLDQEIKAGYDAEADRLEAGL